MVTTIRRPFYIACLANMYVCRNYIDVVICNMYDVVVVRYSFPQCPKLSLDMSIPSGRSDPLTTGIGGKVE